MIVVAPLCFAATPKRKTGPHPTTTQLQIRTVLSKAKQKHQTRKASGPGAVVNRLKKEERFKNIQTKYAKPDRGSETNGLCALSARSLKNTTTRRFIFYLIDCFPLGKDDCVACECLESQPVAHDCA